jgi:MFS family permease
MRQLTFSTLSPNSYVLFSIGNVKPLFQASFPGCWKHYTVCNKTWVQSVDYLEVCGIIVGQILVGVIGDWIGRRWGLIQDCFIMFLGLIMLVCAWGTSLSQSRTSDFYVISMLTLQ